MGKFLPYAAAFLAILGIAKVGSDSKNDLNNDSLNMNAFAASDYDVSADQLSALYVVANVSDSLNLASVETVASNYVMVSVMKEISQTSTDKIEKPNLVNTNFSRGVQNYVVNEGETMATIAARNGLTTDQIRWSNGLKTTDLSAGQVLKLPTVAGIVYTTKAGDTPETLASKYGSSAERIIAYNDLEGVALSEGAQIVLPGGVLPTTERPEYVAPVYNYNYFGSTSERQNIHVVYEPVSGAYGNAMVYGQCTYYTWWKRGAIGRPLPTSLRGDAKYWAVNLARLGYTVDRNPEVGAIFQTTTGVYGHVGVVIAVNGDGSIVVREMNYAWRWNTVTESTIPANVVRNFNYIH